MDVSYINPFIKATIDTFTTMLSIELKTGNPVLKVDAVHTYDISGVIGLSGEAQGIISLSYPKDVAFALVGALLGTTISDVNHELIDGVGEITNIVAGNAKQYLSNFQLKISLPNVVIGSGHRIEVQSGVKTIIVPLVGDLGEFVMEVSLKTR